MVLRSKMKNLFMIFLVNIVYSVVYLTFCYDDKHWTGMSESDTTPLFDKLFNRLYFSVVTFSSVGYGDITPVTQTARSLVMVQILFNINNIVRLILER